MWRTYSASLACTFADINTSSKVVKTGFKNLKTAMSILHSVGHSSDSGDCSYSFRACPGANFKAADVQMAFQKTLVLWML